MRTVFFIGIIFMASCTQEPLKKMSPAFETYKKDSASLLAIAKGKQMFGKVRHQLDLTKITQVTGAENVQILTAPFKDDPNKVYGINTLGNEIFYTAQKDDEKNGSITLIKNDDALLIEFVDGNRTIRDMKQPEYEQRLVSAFHGGPGFCQRQKGESFGTCFRAESDEFCDSFISCIALNTQPTVLILIGLACSCNP